MAYDGIVGMHALRLILKASRIVQWCYVRMDDDSNHVIRLMEKWDHFGPPDSVSLLTCKSALLSRMQACTAELRITDVIVT